MREPSIYMKDYTFENIWKQFAIRFQHKNSASSYFSDISEYCDFCKKDFLETNNKDAKDFHTNLMNKYENGILKFTTLKKKMRVLNVFSNFIVDNREIYDVPKSFSNFFIEQTKYYFSEDEVKRIPSEKEMEDILKQAESNLMFYTIILLVYKVGLKPSQICALQKKDVVKNKDGYYLKVKEKKEIKEKAITGDLSKILKQYLCEREDVQFLFYNSQKRKTNERYLQRMMSKVSKNVGYEYTLRDVRNSCAVMMFKNGATQKEVESQLGITNVHVKRYKKQA